MRDQIFISYSHKDRQWLEQIKTILQPHVRSGQLSLWDDTKIKPGADWRKEIEAALASAKVAVLLISSDFLASDFIIQHELHPLLSAAEAEGLTILWIAVRSSIYKATALERYQALNDPQNPLANLEQAKQESQLVEICKQIQELVGNDMEASMKQNNEVEIKLSLSSETQARIFPNIPLSSPNSAEQVAEQLLTRLRALFIFAGFSVTSEKRVTNTDAYYDTPTRNLKGSSNQLRVRQTSYGYELTVKHPREREPGIFTRDEESKEISKSEYDDLKTSNFRAIVAAHYKDLIGRPMVHTVTVINARIKVNLVRLDEEYELAIDRLKFINPKTDSESAEQLEIEIEAKSDIASKRIGDLRSSLCKIYPEFDLSDKTKYEAALDYIDKESARSTPSPDGRDSPELR